MQMSFEKLLVLHCAPALAGIKPASLFAVREKREEARQKAAALSRQCEGLGICFSAIDISESTTLLFVYNRELLAKVLSAGENVLFLAERGYAPFAPTESAVRLLCQRLKAGAGGFPHEIGVFLGYPLEDVKGFIANEGRACKMRGYWKVYGDEKRARALFDMYAECNKKCFTKAAEGYSIPELCSGCWKIQSEVS